MDSIVVWLNKMLLHMAFDIRLNMVFNPFVNKTNSDAELIRNLGGPSKVAELIGIDKRGGAQRVQNWITRGIPDSVKVKHPQIFLRELIGAAENSK